MREENRHILEDPDKSLRELAAEDDQTFTETLNNLIENVFPSLIVPPSETAHMSALMELKSGVGGSESNLFLSELMRMYLRYAHSAKWKTTTVSSLDNPEGGVKNAVIEFKGPGAYDSLRWESGVHRVQRVPATEASGRVHTSTVAVVVSRFAMVLLRCLICLNDRSFHCQRSLINQTKSYSL